MTDTTETIASSEEASVYYDYDVLYHPFDLSAPYWNTYPALADRIWEDVCSTLPDDPEAITKDVYQTWAFNLECALNQQEQDRLFLVHWLMFIQHAAHRNIFDPELHQSIPNTVGFNGSYTGGALSALVAYFTGNDTVPIEFQKFWLKEALSTYSQIRKLAWENFLVLYRAKGMSPAMRAFMDMYALELKIFLFASSDPTFLEQENIEPLVQWPKVV